MKKVVFNDKRVFEITQSEFEEAYIEWKKKKEFFCKRLDAIITPFYMYVCPLYDESVFERRILPNRPKQTMAYSKERRELWVVDNWPYEKLLKSITGEETFEGLIPKLISLRDVPEDQLVIMDKALTEDDFLDRRLPGYQK